MQQIDIDFEVWKALTSLRTAENHSYNDVLRSLLKLALDAPQEQARVHSEGDGRKLGGRFLPNGTRLRARYKDEWYYAEISNGELIGQGGRAFPSASAAARAVTGTNVNGLGFWQVKKPSDAKWCKLLQLPRPE